MLKSITYTRNVSMLALAPLAAPTLERVVSIPKGERTHDVPGGGVGGGVYRRPRLPPATHASRHAPPGKLTCTARNRTTAWRRRT